MGLESRLIEIGRQDRLELALPSSCEGPAEAGPSRFVQRCRR